MSGNAHQRRQVTYLVALYASRPGAFPVALALCSAVTPLHVHSSEDNMAELIATLLKLETVNGRDHPVRPAGR